MDEYLEPLAALPGDRPHLRLRTRVLGVSRRGFDKLKTAERERGAVRPARRAGGGEAAIVARAVIDASGTYESPNPLGARRAAGASARPASASAIFYGIPEVLGARARALRRPARRRSSGAATPPSTRSSISATLASAEPGTRIIVGRPARRDRRRLFGGGRRTRCRRAARWATGCARWSRAARCRTRHRLPIAAARPRRTRRSSDEPRRHRWRPSTRSSPPPASGRTSPLLRELRLELDPVAGGPVALAPAHRPERPQLRDGAPAWRRGTRASPRTASTSWA